MSLTLLVGESNPYGVDPYYALYPFPAHASGGRLARILGMSPDEYLGAFDRRNLLIGRRWSVVAAREEAGRLTHSRRVLLGARVAAAHGLPFRPFTSTATHFGKVVILPHPSGRSRAWSDPASVQRARDCVRPFILGTEPTP